MQVKFYKNVEAIYAKKGKNSKGANVDYGSVIFADDGSIYLKDTDKVHVYGGSSTLPDAYKKYLDSQISKEAQNALSVSISLSTSSCVVDKQPTSQQATLTVKYNGTNVDADQEPSGWTRTGTGVYIKNLKTVTDSSGDATVIYTIQSGEYKGLTVQKTASSKQMSLSYPAWYGVTASKDLDIAAITNLIPSATRIESNLSNNDYTWVNNLSTSAYGFILTRGSASASQAGISIISVIKSGIRVTSNGQDISGYTLYATDKSISAKGSAQKVSLSIRTA